MCYQLPALHTGKVAVIVSPLTALMSDQVNMLNERAAAVGEHKWATKLVHFDNQDEAAVWRGEIPAVFLAEQRATRACMRACMHAYMHACMHICR